MRLRIVLMALLFSVSMMAQTAAPAPAGTPAPVPATKAGCCAKCKKMSKDGKGAMCARKSGDKMAMGDCCMGKKGNSAKGAMCARKGSDNASKAGCCNGDKTAKCDCCKGGDCPMMKDGKSGGMCNRKAQPEKAGA